MRVRIGKDIKIKWAVLTDGSALPLNKEELTLELAGPNGKSQSMEFEVEGNVLTTTFYGKDQNYTGDYMLTLWKNKGKEGQSVVDKTSAFSLVRYTPQEDLAQKHDNLSATLADLGDTSLVTIDGASETTLVCNLTGYKAVEDVSDLPMEPSTIGYLVGDNLYVYVGEGGDVRLGAYKNCGPFRGLKGDTGAQGPQGNSGYQGAAGELEVVNDLTSGGEAKALSAEQGKVLDGKKQDNLQTYHESGDHTETSIGVHNVILAQASCSDNTRSSLLLVDKDETDVPEDRTAMLYTENNGNGNYIQAGKDAVSLKAVSSGAADSNIEITPKSIQLKGAQAVEVTSPGGIIIATGEVDGENTEVKSNIHVTNEAISMSSPSGGIADVVGVINDLGTSKADKTEVEDLRKALGEETLRATGKESDLSKDIQRLQDETEDLQSMRDTIDMLGTDKADKSALETTNKAVEGKQDKLRYYTENTSTDTAVIKVSHDTDEATFHEDKVEVGADNCVLLKSEDLLLGEDSYIKVSPEKVSMSSPQGKIDDVVGAVVSNANAIATLNGTGEGSVSKTITDKMAEVVANAPSDFDTLKEIADYIASDKTNAADINNTLTALKTRVYELGDFPSSGVAEAKAAEEAISRNPSISIIHYSVNHTTSHIILQDVNDNLTQQVLYYAGNTYIRHLEANLNASWRKTNPTNIKYNQDSHRIALMHMVNQYGEGDNNIDWVELPTATTTKDGLMTKEQVKSLEGKQDQLANYVEIPGGKTTIKYPNGTARVEVSNVRAALWANDDKVAIAADANGTRMLYTKTAEDGYIEHRDEISIGKHNENSATHITLTSRSTTEDTGEKITNTSTIQVNPEGISMSSPNGEIGDIVKEISEKASSESVSELRQEVEDKAPKVGYAPDLKVNFAKELVGRGEATPEVIGGIRPTGEISIGDGNATIERIKGESVVWNQQLQGITNTSSALAGLSLSMSEDGVISINGTATNSFMNPFVSSYGNAGNALGKAPLGRYVLDVEIINNPDNLNLDIYALNSRISFSPTNTPTTSYKKIGDCSSLDAIGGFGLSKYGGVGTVFNKVRLKVSLHNLTLMFGAGNEPTTIEEFEARKPLNVTNEYNEGTIVSYDGDALKSVGFNAWDEKWERGIYDVATGRKVNKEGRVRTTNLIKVVNNTTYYLSNKYWQAVLFYDKNRNYISYKYSTAQTFTTPNDCAYIASYAELEYGATYKNDVCINLSHSEYRNGEYEPYVDDVHPLPNVKSILDANGYILFPYGLLSAGSVHDEITATKAIKRVGVVDMGDLNWVLHTNGYFQTPLSSVSNIKYMYTDGQHDSQNAISSKYGQANWPNFVSKVEDTVGIGASAIFVIDTSYTTAADLKQSLQGVLLYYELAEPIEVDLAAPLNMTYEAWDFGTEELVAEGATTPLNAEIVYQFNAVDRIRENSSAIDGLEEHVEEHKDDGIELLTNGNLKLTLKGETREFMPATPSGDPMHYAYVNAGAEYNATDEIIVVDAPWKDMVDTIEYKSKWSLDVVDASNVQQMTIKGVEYNYATQNRTSPEGGTYDRYFLVGQSNGVWVEDETKVLHLPKCWYLNGLGDITNAEMLRCYEESPKNVGNYVTQQFGKWSKARTLNARMSAYSVIDVSYLFVSNGNIEVPNIDWAVYHISNMFLGANRIRYVLNRRLPDKHRIDVTYCNTTARIDRAFRGATSLRGCFLSGLVQSVSFSGCGNISKPSILKAIKNATPSSAITITLHADAYARLAEDADIVAALEAKPLVTLVSA